MSIETTNTDSNDFDQSGDETETIPNPERGCGHLEDGKAYLRSDVAMGGELPAFVEFDSPIPFKEDRKRSYKAFPGVQFELSVTGEAGMTTTTPEGEVHEHLKRLERDRPTGTTAGEMASFHSHDLLMSVGKTHYPEPEQFVNEAKIHGVNKAISVTSGNEPPVVNPGRTRLFLIHPNAVEVAVEKTEEVEVERTETVELENGRSTTATYTETEEQVVEETEYVPGIIGYTYLTRVIYTEDADGNVPKYIQDYEATGDLDVVKPGPEKSYAEQEGFDEDGNLLDGAQETLQSSYETGAAEFHDLNEMYPETAGALEAPDVESYEKADLGALAEMGTVFAVSPPDGQDAMNGDEDGALAVVNMDDGFYKVMPSTTLSIEGDTATTHAGPYKVEVTEKTGERAVTVEKTR